jgi:hypothetical protein
VRNHYTKMQNAGWDNRVHPEDDEDGPPAAPPATAAGQQDEDDSLTTCTWDEKNGKMVRTRVLVACSPGDEWS